MRSNIGSRSVPRNRGARVGARHAVTLLLPDKGRLVAELGDLPRLEAAWVCEANEVGEWADNRR